MEQGFAEKSPILASSEQRPYFDESNLNSELGQLIMNTLPLGSFNNNEVDFRYQQPNVEVGGSSQSKQAEDDPLSVQVQEDQWHSRNEDLFTVYMKGITHSREQRQLQENNQGGVRSNSNVAMHVDATNYNYNNVVDHMPNLPIDLPPLPSSSLPTFEGQLDLVGSSQISVPFGNLVEDATIVNTILPSWAAQTYSDAVMMDGSSVPSSRLIGNNNQGNIRRPIVNASIVVNEGGGSYQPQAPTTLSRHKRKMSEEEDNAPIRRRWSRFGQGDQGQSSRASSEDRYSIYDKRYEEIGLPMDPHLRIFNANK